MYITWIIQFTIHADCWTNTLAVSGQPASRFAAQLREQDCDAAATHARSILTRLNKQAGMKKHGQCFSFYRQTMTTTVSSMFIPVHDPDAALAFYRDALGLEVRMDVEADGFRWVTVGTPGQDLGIVLFQPHGGRSQAEGDALLSLVTQGSLQAAIFSTDDLDGTFEKVRASGAEILQEPAAQPWGARDCAVRDPSGNLVRIAQA